MSTKSRRPLAPDDVIRIFDDATLAELAAELPAGADLKRLMEGIREAARIYTREAGEPKSNQLRSEIAKLNRAAERREYEQLAIALEHISAGTRALLNERGARPSLGLTLPESEALRDATRRDQACTIVGRLCRFGGQYVEGRKRPSGRRSRSWRPLLYGPTARRNFPKRDAERNFVIWLGSAWLEATGKPPARMAHHDHPGPFARLVTKCLRLVGAPDADAVELINELHRRRRSSNKS